MPRPRICRRVSGEPAVTYFKPAGVPLRELQEVILSLDEYESLKLKDLHGLEQTECAEKMSISQPTFHRLLQQARKKAAESIIQGKALRVEGGPVMFADTGRRRGRCRRRLMQ